MTNSDTLTKILKWGIYISLFLPLVIFSQYLSPFHFGKVILFRSIVEIMAIFYILLILINKKYRPKWTLILISFSIFTALYIFSGVVGNNFYRSFWGSLERMGGIFSFIHYWIYFIILTSIIKSKEDWHKVLKLSVFVGFLSILFGYGQKLRLGDFFVGWQHGERVIGTIGNPALFAGYLLFILYLSLFFLLKKETPANQKGFFAVVFILGIPIILMTAVRGSILALFGSLFLLALFYVITSKNKKLKISLAAILVLFIIFTSLIFINKNKPWVENTDWLRRITTISIESSTAQTRLWSWDSAIRGWKDKPVFGWGPENFSVLHMKYFHAGHFTHIGSETIWDRAHNTLINTLATMGIVGLLSYLFLLFSIFYFLIKEFKLKRISKATFGVFSAMLIAYIFHNLFIFDTFANYFLFFITMGYINFIGGTRYYSKKEEPEQNKVPSILLILILLAGAILLIYQLNIKPAKANYACTRAILIGRSGQVEKALNKYDEALKYNTKQGAYEIRHKLAKFAIEVAEDSKRRDKTINYAPVLNYAIDQVENNIKDYPDDTIPHLYIGRMYILMGDLEKEAYTKAKQHIREAVEINKTNPRIWYELGQAQLSAGEEEGSYQSFKTALELNPKVATSWWFTGIAAYQANHYQEALEYIEKARELGYSEYKNNIVDIMRMVKIYEKNEKYYQVVQGYELAVNEQPSNPQLYASLAAAYAKIGDYQKAIMAAQKAAEIDPSFQEEAQKFINIINSQ
ncbi:MAG: tetratricopeptide repeat protein [Candidatus Portnoybacteria bacterium]|nr:tetratricopeptide repeat protein [Candidatus Portnoybacteria bacterium]